MAVLVTVPVIHDGIKRGHRAVVFLILSLAYAKHKVGVVVMWFLAGPGFVFTP